MISTPKPVQVEPKKSVVPLPTAVRAARPSMLPDGRSLHPSVLPDVRSPRRSMLPSAVPRPGIQLARAPTTQTNAAPPTTADQIAQTNQQRRAHNNAYSVSSIFGQQRR